MVKRSTRLALVALAVVAVVGFPVVGVGDDSAGATGRASATGPLVEDPLTTTEELLTTTVDSNLTLTETTTTTATTETTTTTSTETSLVTTTTVESVEESTDEVTDSTDEVTNTTDEVTDSTDTVADSTDNVTTSADNVTTSTDEVTDEATNATDEVVNATGGVTDVTDDAVDPISTAHFSFATSSPLVDTATGTLDVTAQDETTGDASGSAGGPSSDQNEVGTTASATTAAADDSDETAASASGANDRTPDRDKRGIPASGSEMLVGMSALTAAALVPQLADALALVGNAGGLLSASSAFAGSTSGGRPGLRSRIDRLWRFVTPFRYSRWDDSDPLDHEVREALYETVERAPGAYLSEVCDRADVALSTARHHLDVLEDEGLVTTAKVRGKRRYYPDHAPDVELTAALEDEGTGEVLHALARLGASHGGRLADELDRDASTVSHHLSRLEDAGLVEREREGRAVVNRLAPEVQAVLRGDGETDDDTDAGTPAVAD